MLGAGVILAAAAVGFTASRGAGDLQAPSAPARYAAAGLLRLSVPSGWRRETPPAVSPLGLTDQIALAPRASAGEKLVIGRTVTPDPQLLPGSLLKALASVPAGQAVRLGHATFYRYLNLSPSGQHGSESVYAVSTTAGTVLGVCSAPHFWASFVSSCEQSLGTLVLASARALPPGPIVAYASALNLAVKRLNRIRGSVGSRLRLAKAAGSQAKAAYALAAAHAQAATALSHLNAGPASAANSAVVAALMLNHTAYRALGHAASLGASARYNGARASVQRAASALTAAYSQLDAFGYSVS